MFDPQTIRETAFRYYDRLGRLERYVAEHLTEPITAERAAEVTGLEGLQVARRLPSAGRDLHFQRCLVAAGSNVPAFGGDGLAR